MQRGQMLPMHVWDFCGYSQESLIGISTIVGEYFCAYLSYSCVSDLAAKPGGNLSTLSTLMISASLLQPLT